MTTYIFKTFEELIQDLEAQAAHKREIAGRLKTTKIVRSEQINQAFAIEQVCNMLRNTVVDGPHVLQQAPTVPWPWPKRIADVDGPEADIRIKMTEASGFITFALGELDRSNRSGASDAVLLAISSAAQVAIMLSKENSDAVPR